MDSTDSDTDCEDSRHWDECDNPDDLIPEYGIPHRNTGADYFITLCPPFRSGQPDRLATFMSPVRRDQANYRAYDAAKEAINSAQAITEKYLDAFVYQARLNATFRKLLARLVTWNYMRYVARVKVMALMTAFHGGRFWIEEEKWCLRFSQRQPPRIPEKVESLFHTPNRLTSRQIQELAVERYQEFARIHNIPFDASDLTRIPTQNDSPENPFSEFGDDQTVSTPFVEPLTALIDLPAQATKNQSTEKTPPTPSLEDAFTSSQCVFIRDMQLQIATLQKKIEDHSSATAGSLPFCEEHLQSVDESAMKIRVLSGQVSKMKKDITAIQTQQLLLSDAVKKWEMIAKKREKNKKKKREAEEKMEAQSAAEEEKRRKKGLDKMKGIEKERKSITIAEPVVEEPAAEYSAENSGKTEDCAVTLLSLGFD